MYVFGYGSLVNRVTHALRPAGPARLPGWRRVWVPAPGRRVALLSVAPAPGSAIDGLLARVEDWDALDRREAAYVRRIVRPVPRAPDFPAPGAALYLVPTGRGTAAAPGPPILLSYLDTVVAGFLAEFGASGVARFFATTGGWEAPVLDDRARPLYPRVVPAHPELRALVDAALAALGADVRRA